MCLLGPSRPTPLLRSLVCQPGLDAVDSDVSSLLAMTFLPTLTDVRPSTAAVEYKVRDYGNGVNTATGAKERVTSCPEGESKLPLPCPFLLHMTQL